jgi:hypothetical protein
MRQLSFDEICFGLKEGQAYSLRDKDSHIKDLEFLGYYCGEVGYGAIEFWICAKFNKDNWAIHSITGDKDNVAFSGEHPDPFIVETDDICAN